MAHVIVVGAGAIGSHLLPHLARSARVSRLTIIDRDRYDAENLTGQDIDARHVGQAKAVVQARRVRRIRRHIQVSAVRAAVEDLPLGALRAGVLLACLDSRAARMTVNQAAWRLGVPWIDAGIDAGGLLARVRAFVPAGDASCLECGWDQADYDVVEQTYPCGAATPAAPTGAPSTLGALAAALQAIECDKLLAGDFACSLAGREVLIDARHHTHSVSGHRRNPRCRMPDHAGWAVASLGGGCAETTLGGVLSIGSTLRDAGEGLWLGVAGQPVVSRLRCASCRVAHATFQLHRHVRAARPRCESCGTYLVLAGADLYDSVAATDVPEDVRDAPLVRLGLRPHDVITLSTPGIAAHFELE